MEYLSTTALSDIIAPLEEFPTSIEFLKSKPESSGHQAIFEHNTFQDDILDHLVINTDTSDAQAESSSARQPLLQILFIESVRDQDGCTTNRLRVRNKTLQELCIRLGINTAFMEAVSIPSIWSKQSCGSFHRYGENDKRHALDGFYHYFENWELGPLHLWWTDDTLAKSTTYLLIDCPERVKTKIKSMACSDASIFLFRPLAIDFLVAEECASWREKFINDRWKEVFDWRDTSGNKMDPPVLVQVLDPQNIQDLHELLRTWNMLFEDSGDLEERLDFLIDTSAILKELGVQRCTYAAEAFRFLRARNHVRQRWLTSFGMRTKEISNYVFSLEAQKVNQSALENAEESKTNTKINTKIQHLTAMIAEETAKDNSSMITIAAMTMLFLPGTFISALFSMVFFTFKDSDSPMEVSPWIWIYFAITIPLTGVVFGFYLYWRRKRTVKRRRNSDVDIEMASRIISSSETAVG